MRRWIDDTTATVLCSHSTWGGARSWVEGIDAALDELARRWGLRLVGALGGGCGGAVAEVERGRRRLVLKAACPPAEGLAEARGLAALAGVGAAPALHATFSGPLGGLSEVSALLCDRVAPGEPLGGVLELVELGGEVDELLSRLGDADVSGLERGGTDSVIEGWCALDAARRARLTCAGWDPDALEAASRELAAQLAGGPEGFVHGDLHPANLLWSGESLVAVDCRAGIGDPAFDVGYLALMASGGAPDAALLGRLCAARGCDPERALSWAAVAAPAVLAAVLAWPWGRERQLEGLSRFVAHR